MPIDPPPSPNPGREAAMVWLKFLGFLIVLVLFGWLVFRLTRAVV